MRTARSGGGPAANHGCGPAGRRPRWGSSGASRTRQGWRWSAERQPPRPLPVGRAACRRCPGCPA
eukprot:15032613-Alexandrium_andersonii.AAC.1